MSKKQLAELVARLTIITGALTNWNSAETYFAKTKTKWQLCEIFKEDYKISELYQRLELLIDRLDNDTQFCLILGNEIKVLQ